MADFTTYAWRLTGRFCYVRGWFGRLVLKVEELLPAVTEPEFPCPEMRRWRKARFADLEKLNGMIGHE